MAKRQVPEQLALNVRPRLAYSAQNFIVHAGVKDAMRLCLASLDRSNFSIQIVRGASRAGKSHFLLRLAQEFGDRGRFPQILESDEWETRCLVGDSSLSQEASDNVYLIDDADAVLMKILPGQSGPIVKWIENLRRSNAIIVVCVTEEIESLPCDEHILSRLKPGVGPQILAPEDADMRRLIATVALQRGFALGDRQIEFLAKRIKRSIPAIEDYMERLGTLSSVLGKSVKLPLHEV